MKTLCCIIICISFITHTIPVESVSIPADKTSPDSSVSIPDGKYASYRFNDRLKDQIKEDIYLTYNGSTSIARINKRVIPMSNREYFLVGDIIKILVEVTDVGDDGNNVAILEYVDPSLEVIDTDDHHLEIYIADTLEDILYYNKGYVPKELESDNTIKSRFINNNYLIEINDLKYDEHIIYWYYVKSKKVGIFNADTIVRSDKRNYPDTRAELDVEIKENAPKFDVKLNVAKLDGNMNEPIEIKYDITYLGGSSVPYNCTIDPIISRKNIIYSGGAYNVSFELYETLQISINTIYTESGVYEFPDLSIKSTHNKNDNYYTNYYTFDENIVIFSWLDNYGESFGITIGIFALSISLFVLVLTRTKEKKLIEERRQLTEELAKSHRDILKKQTRMLDTMSPTSSTLRVLFVCTNNSARSQLAEGLLRHLGGDRYDVHSAGTLPTEVNPLAVEVMAERGIDISGHRSKSLEEFRGQEFEIVVTVCDRAKETCPFFPGAGTRIHKSFSDPADATGSEEERREAFRQVRDEIEAWIEEEFGRISP